MLDYQCIAMASVASPVAHVATMILYQTAEVQRGFDWTAIGTFGLVIATLLLALATIAIVRETRATRELTLVPFLRCIVTQKGFEIKNVGNATAIECSFEFYQVKKDQGYDVFSKETWLPDHQEIGTLEVGESYVLTLGVPPGRPNDARVHCAMRYLSGYRTRFKTLTDLSIQKGMWIRGVDRGFRPGDPDNPP